MAPDPHAPLVPAQQFWDLYADRKITFQPNYDYDNSLESPVLLEVLDMYRKQLWQLGANPVEGDEKATYELFLKGAEEAYRVFLGS